jgi:hypothetical protein
MKMPHVLRHYHFIGRESSRAHDPAFPNFTKEAKFPSFTKKIRYRFALIETHNSEQCLGIPKRISWYFSLVAFPGAHTINLARWVLVGFFSP